MQAKSRKSWRGQDWPRSSTRLHSAGTVRIYDRIIIGSDRRPEIKQGIEGKNVRFRSGRVRDRVGVRDRDRRWEGINFGAY